MESHLNGRTDDAQIRFKRRRGRRQIRHLLEDVRRLRQHEGIRRGEISRAKVKLCLGQNRYFTFKSILIAFMACVYVADSRSIEAGSSEE